METNFSLPDTSALQSQFSQTGGELAYTAAASPLFWFYLWWSLSILIIIGLLLLLRLFLHHREHLRYAFKRKIFLVVLPKEAEEEARKKETTDQKKDIKEVIAVMETLFASFTGIERVRDWSYPLYKFKEFWRGSHRYLSLEVVQEKNLIKFYVVAPEKQGEYV